MTSHTSAWRREDNAQYWGEAAVPRRRRGAGDVVLLWRRVGDRRDLCRPWRVQGELFEKAKASCIVFIDAKIEGCSRWGKLEE